MLASSRGPCGGAGFAGGPWPSPTNRGKRSAKREGGGHPGGRRAGCPHPAGPCGGRGVPRADMESAPTTGGKAHDQPGNHGPCMIANLCRGRCLHRPGDPVAARGLREGHGAPLQTAANVRPHGRAAAIRADVGRDALIPPDLAAARGSNFKLLRCGGRERPPYGAGQTSRQPENVLMLYQPL